ncbi:hypothetical protein H0H81_003661 [Sphagnurus paluster]|uniref:G domain-containing protein n=1 Tax=Sphagnurus paluster TaxID=117069 RepID=A0A9P7KHK2_9AGAR|nr:hypothetical protein H0H81_003661 [Sphagnurus paluster]
MSSNDSEEPIQISKITLWQHPEESRNFRRCTVSIDGKTLPEIEWNKEAQNRWSLTSHPALTVRTRLSIDLRIRPDGVFGIFRNKHQRRFDIDSQKLLEMRGKSSWSTEHGGVALTLDFGLGPITHDAYDGKGLKPTTAEILRICPRFRILVIGKSGVGKSSLINKAFGLTQAKVSKNSRGEADINKELWSPENSRFVLHDSLGFEGGETENLNIVRNFISERQAMSETKDKLHAIWLCFEIPPSGGRVLETGTEQLLKDKVAGKLGPVPVISVFTKYDNFVNSDAYDEDGELSEADFESRARTKLDELCFKPFKECVGEVNVPYVVVSTKPKYKDTLDELISRTQELVVNYIESAGIVTGIAQRASREVKIETLITVGRKKYWQCIGAGFNLPGHTIRQYLEVIHTDIINVWNFNDPHMYLSCEAFRQMMYTTMEVQVPQDGSPGNKALFGGVSLVGTLAGVVSGLAAPAAPIVVPIAAAVVLAVWLNDVYTQSRIMLQRLMTYIVQLIVITQLVSWLQETFKVEEEELTRRIIKLSVEVYKRSGQGETIEAEVKQYAIHANLMAPNAAFQKIVELIQKSRIAFKTNLVSSKTAELFKNFEINAPDDKWDIISETQSVDQSK